MKVSIRTSKFEVTIPKTSSLHLNIGHPKRKQSYSNHQFSGANRISFREGTFLGTW